MYEKRPTKGELWCITQLPSTFTLTVLMPNGLIIDISCCREDSLGTIKKNLWKKAEKQILYRLLNDISSYIFIGLNQDAKLEEFYDEKRHFCDLGLFTTLLKLNKAEGDKDEKVPNAEISLAIGMSLNEIESIDDSEIVEYRENIINFCKEVVDQRENMPLEKKDSYIFSPDLDESYYFDHTNPNLTITVCIWFIRNKNNLTKQSCKIQFVKHRSVDKLIEEALFKILKKEGNENEEVAKNVKEIKNMYIFKVCGIEQYLVGNHPLCRYKYISNCFSQGKCPQLMLINKVDLYQSVPKSSFLMPSNINRSLSSLNTDYFLKNPSQAIAEGICFPLWKFETPFKLKALWATYVNVRDVDKIYVKCGLYHGPEVLCAPRNTDLVDPCNPKWNQSLEFDIFVSDLPRSARLCISICSVSYKNKKSGEHCCLSWANLPLFDYKSKLVSDLKSVNLRPVPKDFTDLLNPLGMVGSNTNKDSPCIEIDFGRYTAPVIFTPDDIIEEYGLFRRKMDFEGKNWNSKDADNARFQNYQPIVARDYELLGEIIERDPCSEMSLQEKNLVWRLREHCLKIPDSLPKLLDAVKWNQRDDVSQLYVLLKQWRAVKFETALELLDCKYADLKVREYAVKWLDASISDELLAQYLLQLVQVVEYEPYLDSGLSRLLIKRSLLNRKIGHYFFWHLKAEMHDPSVRLRCCLLLEAYCRGIGTTFLKSTLKQVEALEKLTHLAEGLKQRKEDNKEKIKFLFDQIQKADYIEALEGFHSPLNHSVVLGKLVRDQCRIMDSAKKPLWLVWSNPDPMAELHNPIHAIIFKSGDDLRQDMLTLQVIRIFDMIWRNEGHDLKMLPYTCLATGKQVGMIEVVLRAKTVMNIQRTGGRMAAFQVDSTQLHKWIKENNSTNYDQAVDTFTKSCAGYCVATFILGIGDRNPDNIMISENGQIFHIDFGHFLGHFKKKFGINRERVPFVLTDDFLYVISKGADNPKKSKEFEKFTELCGVVYLSLRKHANLIITLFTMMLSTGIPELQSIDDIGYLRKTLQVEKSEEEALKYFNTQFFEAHGGAWTTKIDWFFHNIAHLK